MATCDYCGKHYTFGALKSGRYAFCSGTCCDRGGVLAVLDRVPAVEIDRHVAAAHDADCPTCGRTGPIDVRNAYWVWSAIFLTRWGTDRRIECTPCARPRQLKGLLSSLLIGWWGVPFGLVLTPVQVFRNVAALFGRRNGPSPDFRRAMMLNLAQRLHDQGTVSRSV